MAKTRAKRDLRDPVRVRVDPVTHQRVHEVRDAVWWAVLRATAAVENAMLRVPTRAPTLERYAIVARAHIALNALAEHGAIADPLPVEDRIAAEWGRLDAAGRERFAREMRAWLKRMVKHADSDLEQTEAA